MKRRAFVAAGLAALAAATSFRSRRAFAAASTPSADLNAVGLEGAQLTLRGSDVDELRAGLRGELIAPGQAGYDEARRLWNPAFDRHPALIARCVGAADVKHAVSFAAAHGLLTAVRGGGHSFGGQSGCDGGLVIDLSPMRAVEVDPATRQARVGGGALLANLDREAQAFGLATPAGVVADTGVAGLTLGGGMGRLGRK
jgi:FAD/FMN-containing dehydrogenase